MPATLDQVNIVADDLEATVAFYRQLGVEMGDPARTRAGEPFHASNRVDGHLIEADSAKFAKIWNVGWAGEADIRGRVVVGLRVDSREDVDRLFDEVTSRGNRGLQPPYDAFWGARYAVVEDPNGVAVGLMSPIDPGRTGPPPEIT